MDVAAEADEAAPSITVTANADTAATDSSRRSELRVLIE
jgi:hypothetical protein